MKCLRPLQCTVKVECNVLIMTVMVYNTYRMQCVRPLRSITLGGMQCVRPLLLITLEGCNVLDRCSVQLKWNGMCSLWSTSLIGCNVLDHYGP